MNLYKISQSVNEGWDTYDCAVVCAESEEKARLIHPCELTEEPWNGISDRRDGWCDAKDVKVEYLGTATESVHPGVICVSLKAE